MKPTELTRDYVITRYVNPARLRGDKTIEVRVGTVQKELGWTNRTPSIFSTLSSQEFQEEAGVKLVEKRGGPPSGGPSTTWQFVYRILDETSMLRHMAKDARCTKGGLLAMYGIAADIYREAGGGEAFIRSQRENFGSIVSDEWNISAEETK